MNRTFAYAVLRSDSEFRFRTQKYPAKLRYLLERPCSKHGCIWTWWCIFSV